MPFFNVKIFFSNSPMMQIRLFFLKFNYLPFFTNLLFWGTFSNVFAQEILNSTRDRFQNTGAGTMVMNPNTIFYGLEGPKGEFIGTNYLDSTWQKASVRFYKRVVKVDGQEFTLDQINDVPVRVNLLFNVLEFKSEKYGVRMAPFEQVESFMLETKTPGDLSQVFVNVKAFKGVDKLKGFFQILEEGKMLLLKHHSLWIKKPDYVPAFNAGSKDIKAYLESKLYYTSGEGIFKLPASKKSFLAIFSEKKDAIEKLMQEKKLVTKNEHDLILIFKHYNSSQ